ncbi:MAG: hypothetical protein FWD52_02245 [Candidatus Bathyarchaeota archaeon]|nr:hypothetical protein [Candidatus Termiticorpusculum sp.]
MFSESSFFVQGTKTPDKLVKNESELINALSVAPSDKTVYVIGLSADIVLKKSLEIPADKNIVLVSVGDGVWKLVGPNKQNTINVNGLLTLDGVGVTHVEGDVGGGVYVDEGGVLTFLSGKIYGNTDTDDVYGVACGGGVYVGSGGVFVMSGGEIVNNKANRMGGGVYNAGSFSMSGGEISGNNAYRGGGVYNQFYGVFVMSGGIIANNTADFGGGVDNSGGYERGVTFTMTGGKITGNVAKDRGGGLVYMKGSFKWSDGRISGNTASFKNNDVSRAEFCIDTIPPSRDGFFMDSGVWLGKIKNNLFLPIVVTVVSLIVIVVGLFFYRSKKLNQLTTKSIVDSTVQYRFSTVSY